MKKFFFYYYFLSRRFHIRKRAIYGSAQVPTYACIVVLHTNTRKKRSIDRSNIADLECEFLCTVYVMHVMT